MPLAVQVHRFRLDPALGQKRSARRTAATTSSTNPNPTDSISFIDEIWENQRYWPGLGWKPWKNLQWSNRTFDASTASGSDQDNDDFLADGNDDDNAFSSSSCRRSRHQYIEKQTECRKIAQSIMTACSKEIDWIAEKCFDVVNEAFEMKDDKKGEKVECRTFAHQHLYKVDTLKGTVHGPVLSQWGFLPRTKVLS